VRCVRTRAAQTEVATATEKDVAAISDALKQAVAAEDYALAARLRDELQQLPEVLLEAQLQQAIRQEDYAVRPGTAAFHDRTIQEHPRQRSAALGGAAGSAVQQAVR